MTIPDWIKNGSFGIKSAFIRALFDDEGTVINSKGNYVISFGMNKKKNLLDFHKNFIEDIRQIVFSLNVNPNKTFERKQPKDSIQLGFHITGRYNLIKFLQNIGFTNREKQEKLIQTINSCKTYSKNETKIRILDALKINGSLRTKELSNIVNRDRKVIWKNLHKLEEKRLVKKFL